MDKNECQPIAVKPQPGALLDVPAYPGASQGFDSLVINDSNDPERFRCGDGIDWSAGGRWKHYVTHDALALIDNKYVPILEEAGWRFIHGPVSNYIFRWAYKTIAGKDMLICLFMFDQPTDRHIVVGQKNKSE